MRWTGIAATMVALAGLMSGGNSQTWSQDPGAVVGALGLVPMWSMPLSRSDLREEVLYAQLLDSDLLLVQMRSGSVWALDAFKGLVRWQVNLGKAFAVYQRPAVASERLVVVPANVTLNLYERQSGVRLWQVELKDLSHRAPLCDDSHLAVLEGESRLRCWILPHIERYLSSLAAGQVTATKPSAARSIFEAGVSSYERRRQLLREPENSWDFQDQYGFDIAPVSVGQLYVAFANREGKLRIVAMDQMRLVGEWQAPGQVSAPMSFRFVERHEDNVVFWESWLFVPCSDNALYAFRIHQGKLTAAWQRVLGDVVHREPVLLAQDLFVTTRNRGLFCLDRDTGQVRWQQMEARQFVAVSPRLVFALDHLQRLIVLDRRAGHVLSRTNGTGKWLVVENRFTDRVYLIGEDGRLHCFRDRSPECHEPRIYYRLRFVLPAAQAVKPVEKPEPAEAKPEEKP